MYIIRLSIDKRNWYRRNLDNPNAHKGMLWHLFYHHNLPDNSGGWVFRVDKKDDQYVFFIISKFSPMAEALESDGIKIDVKEMPDTIFTPGSRYTFKARVNAVTTSHDGKRIGKDSKDIPSWMSKQMGSAAKCVCEVESVGVQRSYKNRQVITHHEVNIRGLIEVIDGQLLANLLVGGVGHAKRYGFGLIALNV